MRIVTAFMALVATTTNALAVDVPEIDALSGAAAIGLVGAVAALVWERRRR